MFEHKQSYLIHFKKNFNLNSSFKIENVVGKFLTKNKNINPRKI